MTNLHLVLQGEPSSLNTARSFLPVLDRVDHVLTGHPQLLGTTVLCVLKKANIEKSLRERERERVREKERERTRERARVRESERDRMRERERERERERSIHGSRYIKRTKPLTITTLSLRAFSMASRCMST